MPQTKTKRKPPSKRRPGAEERADKAAESRMRRESDDAQRARYRKCPLAFTIHDADLSPNSRAQMEPRTDPYDWSASECRVAEAALQGHMRLAVPCPRGFVAQMAVLIAHRLRNVPKLLCGFDEANGQIIVWNMSEEDDANDVEMLLP